MRIYNSIYSFISLFFGRVKRLQQSHMLHMCGVVRCNAVRLSNTKNANKIHIKNYCLDDNLCEKICKCDKSLSCKPI